MKGAMQKSSFSPIERAGLHPIVCDKPAVNFFEGALMGNGGLGVVITTRPDALAIRFGHNAVWDIRCSEATKDQIGTFQETFERINAIPETYASLHEDADYAQFIRVMESSYQKSYPRPYPCGSLILGWDRREAEVLGHRLDIATGLCEVYFLVAQRRAVVQIFVGFDADRLWIRTVDEQETPIKGFFNRVRLLPNPNTAVPPFDTVLPDPQLPAFQIPTEVSLSALTFRQVMPFAEPDEYDAAVGHPDDQAFRLSIHLNSTLGRRTFTNWYDQPELMGDLERAIDAAHTFIACVQFDHGLAIDLPIVHPALAEPTDAEFIVHRRKTQSVWAEYWSKSGVALADTFLERIWYWNLYFFNCAVKPGVNAPGLFANWSYRRIGTAWHGDYHMNYNTQQPFWLSFSSNHVDKHLAYVELVEQMLPFAQRWASHYYELRGANFPHSAYPVSMSIPPYPAPTWAWEMCETPWTVQSLWWHYLYTQDRAFLRNRAFPLLKEAVLFMVDYMRRPEAHGTRWQDDKYHIFPTVSPELYNGLLPGFRKNYDCLVDLTLTKFLFKAYLEATTCLDYQSAEVELTAVVTDVLEHFPAYPTAQSPHGDVFVSVPGEDPAVVYNTPNALMVVFPGEEYGLHSDPAQRAIANNTYRNQQIEGGNELVFQNLQAARLGVLDLEKFKRQLRYCLQPNGTCTDMALQVGGRFDDSWDYDFMARMGIWFENFAIPVVINECLLQSYNGVLRLFPNWTADAELFTLRAVGGFLVSAAQQRGVVQWVKIFSEAGQPLKLYSPWATGTRITHGELATDFTEEIVMIDTEPNGVICLTNAGIQS